MILFRLVFYFLLIGSFCRLANSQISIYLESKTNETELEVTAQAIRLSVFNQLDQVSNIKTYEGNIHLPDEILKMDKVELLSIRRQTGLDGLIKVEIQSHQNHSNLLLLTLSLIDFSAGQIVCNQNFEDRFGISLLAKIEDQVSKFLPVLIHYYDAKLSIISEPSSAEIWLNDQKIGQTPSQSLAVLANHPHQLEIKKKGYVTHRRVVKIQSGQHLLVDIDLIDQITDQLLQKQRHLDSMNFSLGSQLHLHSLNQSILKVLPATSFRYLSKFGTWQFGLDFSSISWEGKQKIDTVLGPNTGNSRFTFQMNRFVFLSQYNLIEWTNQLDLYVGLQLGITSSQFDYQTTPIIDHRLTELETSNPVAGVEVGSRIYFGHHLKMQLFTGAEFGGTVIYYQKQANYWGDSTYQKQTISLNRLYFGLAGTYSLWPKRKRQN